MKWGMLKENNHFKSTTTISPTKHIPKQTHTKKKLHNLIRFMREERF